MTNRKLEKLISITFGVGAVSYILLMISYGTFLSYLVLFTSATICLSICLLPSFDLTWRSTEISSKTILAHNIILKVLCGIILFWLINYLVPYYKDLPIYVKKNYQFEIGYINKLESSKVIKSHYTWRCNVNINGKQLKFERIRSSTKESLERINENGEKVGIWYLPNTKLAVAVKQC